MAPLPVRPTLGQDHAGGEPEGRVWDELAEFVVVVAADPAARSRLSGAVPVGCPLLLVASAEEARAALQPSATGRVVGPLGGLHVHADRPVARLGPREVGLTRLEHRLLRCLLERPEDVWSFAALTEAVWGTTFVGDGCHVRALVKRLRCKLAGIGAEAAIETVRGAGLRIAGPAGPVAGPRN